MLDQALGKLAGELAVDLGTSNTRVFVRGRGIVVEDPSVVAVEQAGSASRVLAVGQQAKRMVGRTPEHITAVHPIQRGVISDYDLAEALLRDCVGRALSSRPLVKPRMLVCVPHDTTEVQQRAVQDSARAAGAREIQLLAKSVAAAVGAGMTVHEARAGLLVDLGGGTTEIAVLSLGGVLAATSLGVAGTNLDAALAAWVQKRHNVLIGERTAEEVKLAVGCATPSEQTQAARVTGRDLSTGIPREVEVTSDDCAEAFQPPLARIIEGLRQLLAEVSPEVASDIAEDGIVLAGGTALLTGLDRFLQDHTGLRVSLAEDPQRASALGAGRLLDDPESLARLAL